MYSNSITDASHHRIKCRRSLNRSHFHTICGHDAHADVSRAPDDGIDYEDRSTLFVRLKYRTRKMLTKLININTSDKLHRKVYNFASPNRSLVSTFGSIYCVVHLFLLLIRIVGLGAHEIAPLCHTTSAKWGLILYFRSIFLLVLHFRFAKFVSYENIYRCCMKKRSRTRALILNFSCGLFFLLFLLIYLWQSSACQETQKKNNWKSKMSHG